MSDSKVDETSAQAVFVWIKREFFQRYWRFVSFMVVFNVLFAIFGYREIQRQFTDYLDAQLEKSKSQIQEIRDKAGAAGVISNNATTVANQAAQTVNTINENAIKTRTDLYELKSQLDGIQKQSSQLPDLAQKLVDASKALGDYERVAEELRKKNGWVHLGMIVPYFGSALPEGFVWADGTERWPMDDWVPAHLRGQPVPNLNGRTLRGAANDERVGEVGGRDEIPAYTTKKSGGHQHMLPDHKHSLPEHTGPISLGPEIPPGTRYTVMDDHDKPHLKWGSNEEKGKLPAHHLRVDGGDNDSGQHQHGLPQTTLGLSQNVQTGVGGDHSHLVDAIPFVPSYMSVKYIIRVR